MSWSIVWLVWLTVLGLLFIGVIGVIGVITAAPQVVDYTDLIKKLPQPPNGWTANEPEGLNSKTPAGAFSFASREYTQSGTDRIVDVTIFGGGDLMPFWQEWQGLYAYESTDGYAKRVTVNDFPAWEVYSNDTGEYMLYIGINRKIGVVVTTDQDKDTLYLFANSIDYSGLAALCGAINPTPLVTPGEAPPTATSTPASGSGDTGKTPGFGWVHAIAGAIAALYILRR